MPTMMKTLMIMSWISLLLSGCATGSKDTVLPQDGPTMKEVYEHHFNGDVHHQQSEGRQTVITNNIRQSRLRDNRPDDLPQYTRNAKNEIQTLFPRLKNKTLIMYVFPHLSKGDRHPVPGYSTAFTFYEKTEYALPGEQAEGY